MSEFPEKKKEYKYIIKHLNGETDYLNSKFAFE